MPASEKSSRAFATTSSSCSRPTAARIGALALDAGLGLALCATTQIEQEASSFGVGWTWVHSSAAVHTIRDRQSHADHRIHNRMEDPRNDFPLWN